MDFEVTYTPEQEAFRAEVRAWLIDNIPEGLQQPDRSGRSVIGAVSEAA